MIALGAWQRVTYDVDAILPPVDTELKAASHIVAKKLNLAPNWLNNGPATLALDLTPGWEARSIQIFAGKNLTVHSLSRIDMLYQLWK